MVLTRGEQGADCETAGYFAILSRTTISSSRPVKVNSYKKRRACINMQTNGHYSSLFVTMKGPTAYPGKWNVSRCPTPIHRHWRCAILLP